MKQILTIASAGLITLSLGVSPAKAQESTCAFGDRLEQPGFDMGHDMIMRKGEKGEGRSKSRGEGRDKGKDRGEGRGKGKGKGNGGDFDVC
jgi:hypothetical protein